MLEYEKILLDLIEKDDKLMVLTAENRAPLRNVADKIGDRFVDTGITEQAMIGIAAGLALRGRRPVTHALAPFLTMRAYEFIRTDVGISGLPVKMVGWVPGVLSDGNGPTHQAIEDVSIMRGIPGMQVFCPADENDLNIGVRKFLEADTPGYMRYNHMKPVYEHSKDFEIGKAEKVFSGTDVVFLTYGALFEQVYKATELLTKEKLSVGLLNMRMLSPVDTSAMIEAAQTVLKSDGLIVTVEDHFLTGGLATILAETMLKNRLAPRVMNIGFDQKWFKPATLPEVLEHEGLTAQALAGRVLRHIKEMKNA